mmetsp:Transcript_89947/g.284764  ORF Transcript_89947/g.284764 Transcript_89947/m.284764 type:complete len:202 (+) Transcript_89947:159-764(+)
MDPPPTCWAPAEIALSCCPRCSSSGSMRPRPMLPWSAAPPLRQPLSSSLRTGWSFLSAAESIGTFGARCAWRTGGSRTSPPWTVATNSARAASACTARARSARGRSRRTSLLAPGGRRTRPCVVAPSPPSKPEGRSRKTSSCASWSSEPAPGSRRAVMGSWCAARRLIVASSSFPAKPRGLAAPAAAECSARRAAILIILG